MTYRDDAADALLRERFASLEAELADVKTRRQTESVLRTREEALRTELAQLQIQMSRKTRREQKLPMLASLAVASPCSAKWDAMFGDEKTRFCGSCAKNVHNLSAMSATEAEAFLQDSVDRNSSVCVRYFQREDGTVMTQDCPVGVRRKRLRRFAALAIGAGAAGAAVSSYLATMSDPKPCAMGAVQGEAADLATQPVTMGSAMPVDPLPPKPTPSALPVMGAPEAVLQATVGRRAPPPPKSRPKTSAPPGDEIDPAR